MNNLKHFNTAFFVSAMQTFVLALGLMMLFTATAKASSTLEMKVSTAQSKTLAGILQREIKQNDATKAVELPKAKTPPLAIKVALNTFYSSKSTAKSHWRKNGQVVLGHK